MADAVPEHDADETDLDEPLSEEPMVAMKPAREANFETRFLRICRHAWLEIETAWCVRCHKRGHNVDGCTEARLDIETTNEDCWGLLSRVQIRSTSTNTSK